MSERLPERPGEAIRRDRRFTVRFEGREIPAYEGDTVGSALAAAGVRITSRSFKYHRPRGLLCMTGSCPNCLMQIDGIPNVRACTEPLCDGMRVERQNAWPNADRDVHGWLDAFSFMMPPGFYYKVFQRPRWAWPFIEPFIRSKAGLGKVPEQPDHRRRERINLHPEVLVIGGGAAGLAAATEAARAGATVVVLEQGREAGGHLLTSGRPASANASWREAQEAGANVLLGTAAVGIFGGPLVAAASADAIYRIRARQLIFATGSIEQYAVFPNNDLPGVMLSSAVELLVGRYAILPGRRAVVVASGTDGYSCAWQLKEAGAQVTVVDLRSEGGWPPGFPVIAGSTIIAAHGKRRVTGVTVGAPGATSGQKLPCDLLVLTGHEAPSTGLLAQAGATLAFDTASQVFLPADLPSGVQAAGAVAGARATEAAVAQGRAAGLTAAQAVGRSVDADAIEALRKEAATKSAPDVLLPPAMGAGSGKQFACLCMDVTSKELKTAVAEGFDSMELLKRYTTVTMGPCQGKACLIPSQRLCGVATEVPYPDTAGTTARPPWVPLEMGTLAGSRFTPRRETSMHDRHVAAGAEFMWAGEWRRPHHYTSPEEEVDSVRNRVGLIDVSTLGKFRIRGPGAVDLLERLYPCRFSDLKVGRIRYGAMLNDEGVIIDDGAVVRVDDEEFFVTVTTGNTAALERWITWWNADWRFDAQVLNLTGAYGAVNLAGPRSRSLMASLTDEDVSREGLPYLSAKPMSVAGVPALVLRLGFVGELGYEIHFPSAYGDAVWDTVMETGRDAGIAAFGLEAQRILRLEKQHILVGQDTDAESDPYEVGLGWMVKDDKDDFLGLRALRELKEPRERLVGFTAPIAWLPPEGSSVVDDHAWVGRVTSARRSAAVGSVIGLAWVPADWARDGHAFEIQFGGSHTTGTVRTEPFYDPAGERLRS